MRITQWGEYGILCTVEIARGQQAGLKTVGAQQIADAQHIQLEYAQQILQRLRKGGVIESLRGPQGGYMLAREPEQITLLDILTASEGETFEVICITKPIDAERCHHNYSCGLRGIWFDFREYVDTYFKRFTVKTLLDRELQADAPITIGGARAGADIGPV